MIFSSREHLKWSQHKVCLTLERIRKLTKDRARHLGQITIMLSIWHTFQTLYFIHKATCKDWKKVLRLSPTLKKRLSTQAVFRLTEVTQEQKREGSSGRTCWPWQWAAYKHSPIGTMWKHFSLFFSHFSTWAWRSHGGEMGILVRLETALCCVTNRRGDMLLRVVVWQHTVLMKDDGLPITAGRRKGRRQSTCQTKEHEVMWRRKSKNYSSWKLFFPCFLWSLLLSSAPLP